MKKLIETDLYHLEVGTEAEIKAPCYITDGVKVYPVKTDWDGYINLYLITAHRPKGNAPILEGVPLMGEPLVRLEEPHADKYGDMRYNKFSESPSEDDEVERLAKKIVMNNNPNGEGNFSRTCFDGLVNDITNALKAAQQSEKKYTNDILVKESGLSVRVMNIIHTIIYEGNKGNNSIINKPLDKLMISDIAKISYLEWIKYRNCGKRSVNEIKRCLSSRGFTMPYQTK